MIVNDCSQDRTGELADRLASRFPDRARVLHHPANGGEAEALKAGFAATVGGIVMVQDADLEYNPRDVPLRQPPLGPQGRLRPVV